MFLSTDITRFQHSKVNSLAHKGIVIMGFTCIIHNKNVHLIIHKYRVAQTKINVGSNSLVPGEGQSFNMNNYTKMKKFVRGAFV